MKRTILAFAGALFWGATAAAQLQPVQHKTFLRFKDPYVNVAATDTFTMVLVVENMPDRAGIADAKFFVSYNCNKIRFVAQRVGADAPNGWFQSVNPVLRECSPTGRPALESSWHFTGGLGCDPTWSGGELVEFDFRKVGADADSLWFYSSATFPEYVSNIRCCDVELDTYNACGSCGGWHWPAAGSCIPLRIGRAAQVVTDGVPLTAAVQTAVTNKCMWCHQHEPFVAGQPLNESFVLTDEVPQIWTSVEDRRMPRMEHLANATIDSFEVWTDDAGYVSMRTSPATNFFWQHHQAVVQGGKPPRGHFFSLEDSYIDGAWSNNGDLCHRWSVEQSFTDVYGITWSDNYVLDQYRITNPDSFDVDANQTVFGLIGGPQRWNGRFYDYTLIGSVWGHHTGRNIGITFLISNLHPGSRSDRNYVTLIIDSLGVFLRSAPMAGESPPFEEADSLLVGHTGVTVASPNWQTDQWLSYHIETSRALFPSDTLGTVVRAVVRRVSNDEVYADLYGVAIDDTTMSGAWALSKFGSGLVRFANTEVYARVDTTGIGDPPLPHPGQKKVKPEITDPGGDEDSDIPPED